MMILIPSFYQTTLYNFLCLNQMTKGKMIVSKREVLTADNSYDSDYRVTLSKLNLLDNSGKGKQLTLREWLPGTKLAMREGL